MKGGPDTSYLKDTVGEALARGCAAAIQSQPNDPVEFLGLWLLKCVRRGGPMGRQWGRVGEAQRIERCVPLAVGHAVGL